MSIYLNKDSRIIVQGMTGGMGSKHTTLMLAAGSSIVGGVNARKAGPTAEVWSYLDGPSNHAATRMIGPNCPGIITPGESLAGITPHTIAGKGPVGLVTKTGTQTYQKKYKQKDFGF